MGKTAAFGGSQSTFYEIGDGSLGSALSDLHCAAAKELGFDLNYVPRKLEKGGLASAYRALRADADGFVVTTPFKTQILMLLDFVDDDARSIGACDVVAREGGKYEGLNTGWISLYDLLKARGLRPHLNEALVIGTGAAARASLYSLWRLGFTRMKMMGRNPERSQAIARGLGFTLGVDLLTLDYPGAVASLGLSAFDIIVNATPLGREGGDPLMGASLPAGPAVVDLALSVEGTPLVRRASEGGRLVVSGIEAARMQAALDVRACLGGDDLYKEAYGFRRWPKKVRLKQSPSYRSKE